MKILLTLMITVTTIAGCGQSGDPVAGDSTPKMLSASGSKGNDHEGLKRVKQLFLASKAAWQVLKAKNNDTYHYILGSGHPLNPKRSVGYVQVESGQVTNRIEWEVAVREENPIPAPVTDEAWLWSKKTMDDFYDDCERALANPDKREGISSVTVDANKILLSCEFFDCAFSGSCSPPPAVSITRVIFGKSPDYAFATVDAMQRDTNTTKVHHGRC